jgi:hypothetical protein
MNVPPSADTIPRRTRIYIVHGVGPLAQTRVVQSVSALAQAYAVTDLKAFNWDH